MPSLKMHRNPVFIVGLLMFVLFLFNREEGVFFSRDKLTPTSCQSALVMLNRRMPKDWKTLCSKNNLLISINEKAPRENLVKVKTLLYRQLANHLQFVSRNSLNETLERTETVTMHLDSPSLSLTALTTGQSLAQMASLKESKAIALHLQATVKVKEVVK